MGLEGESFEREKKKSRVVVGPAVTEQNRDRDVHNRLPVLASAGCEARARSHAWTAKLRVEPESEDVVGHASSQPLSLSSATL